MAEVFRGPIVSQPPRKVSRTAQTSQTLGTNPILLQLAGQDAFPARVNDWPVPVLKARARPDAVWSDLLLTTLGIPVGPAPFGQTDWPLPRGKEAARELRTFAPPALLATRTIPGVPFRPIEWLVPKGKPRALQVSMWRPTSAAPIPRVPFPFGSVFDLPVLSRYPMALRTFLKPYDAYLVPALASVLPFGLTDWPIPRSKAAAIELRTWVPSKSPLLTGVDALPFSQTSWPNPLGKVFPLDNRTYLEPLNPTLIGKDQFFGGQGQPPTYQPFPVPYGKPFPLDLRTFTQSLNNLTLSPFVQPPLTVVDWPVPNGRAYPSSLRFHTAFYVIDDSAPFAQNHWPVPSPIPALRDLRSFTQSTKLNLISGDVLPYRLNDWPLPMGTPSLRQLRMHLDRLNLLLASQDALPFRANDWPLPTGRAFARELRTFLQALNVETNGTDVLPYRLNDWPLPRVKAAALALRLIAERRNTLLKDTFYGLAGQPPVYPGWPIPTGRAFPSDLRTHVSNALASYFAPTFKPEWAKNATRIYGPTAPPQGDIE